jgi:adenylate kinase
MRPWGVSGNVDPKLSKSNSNSEFTSVAVSTDLKQDLESINSLGLEFAASKNATKAQIQSHGQSRQGPPCIVLMGGPSSGKGTQSERIVQHYDVVHLSTGDMLREVVQRDAYSPTGEIAKLYMERGELVPDDIITKIVLDRISQPDCLEHGWILDGFPRTRGQAEAMKRNGLKPDLFVLLNVPDANLLERVAGRRTDPVTGKIYHLQFFPPPTREIEKRLVQRSDDTVPHMAKRLEQFHANVNSVRHFFQDVCVEVNGMGSPDEVAENVFKAIDGRQLKTA